jgi:hypothetical protein
MIKIWLILLLALSHPSTTTAPINEIVSAIDKGNAGQLSRYFDQVVEVALPDKTSSYSRRQAEMVIGDFFKANNVRSFILTSTPQQSLSKYFTGNLITSNGVFKTSVFVKQKGKDEMIQELRFEK